MRRLLIALLLLLPGLAAAQDMNRDSSKECAVCHYEWMPEFVFDLKGTELVAFQSEKVVSDEKMCFSCHNGSVGDSRIKIWAGDSHKLSEKIPKRMSIPADLPLYNGKISCRTCHTAHATGDPKSEGVEKSLFLRMKNSDSQLCEACHSDMGQYSHPLKTPEKNYTAIEKKLTSLDAKLGTKGRIICQSCHTSHSPRERKLLIYPEGDSRLCSICHDDKVNPDNAAYVKGMLNHPINVIHDDPAAVTRVKAAGGIYGKGNEVICLTCHSTHKGKSDTLLIQKDAYEFCLVCHGDKKSLVAGSHNMGKVKAFRTKDGKSAREKGACGCCHAPHGWSLDLPLKEGTLITRGCLSCHREGGFSGEKVLAANRFNHPVDKEISADMSAGGLPLFSDSPQFFEKQPSGNLVTCATCHDVHAENKQSLRVEAANGRLCVTCHRDKEMMEKTGHGRKKLDKGCLSCHTVHNSDNQKLLIATENDGCLECHGKGGSAEKLIVDPTHSHPVGMHVERPLKKEFKLTSQGRFTCSSCHDPHQPSKTATIQKDFLRGGYTRMDDFCLACHESNRAIIGSDHDTRENETDSTCGQCHKVHNAETGANLMAVTYDYRTEDDACKACHSSNGTANKKVITGGHKTGRIDPAKNTEHLTEKDGQFFIYCSTCHSVHQNGPAKGEEGGLKNSFLNRKLFEKGNFCLACHEEKKSVTGSKHNVDRFEKNTKKTTALKAEGDTCGVCHQVHNSDDYLLDKSFEKICTDCHRDKGLASDTSISTSHKLNVVLKEKKDFFVQDGKMVCATCHDPHRENKKMLRDMGGKTLCLACHEEQKAVTVSNHNLARVNYLDAGEKNKARENVCATCHAPHNFDADNRLMWAFEPKWRGVFAADMCTGCHSKNGLGKKKIPEVQTHDRIFKIIPPAVKQQFEAYLYDDDGRTSVNGYIACRTCHDPHVWEKGALFFETGISIGKAGGNFLKQGVTEGFCGKCHGKDAAEELFQKYHDDHFRKSRNHRQSEDEVLRNLMRIQMNFKRNQEKK